MTAPLTTPPAGNPGTVPQSMHAYGSDTVTGEQMGHNCRASCQIANQVFSKADVFLETAKYEADPLRVCPTPWKASFPTDPVFWFDTDAGNDPDDVEAIYRAARSGIKIAGISTTLFRPEEKAQIVKGVLTAAGCPVDVPVYVGYGVAAGDESSFTQKYPAWPKKFGIPGSTNVISHFQAKAYRKFLPKFGDYPVEKTSASSGLERAAATYGDRLIVVAMAPYTNLATTFGSLQRINRIVMMGGWFENKEGGVQRPGYNTGVDLGASKQLLEQQEVPVLLISPQLVTANGFAIHEKEREVFKRSEHMSQLGKAFLQDLMDYWENKIPAKGELYMGDPLTQYIAEHPESILSTTPVRISFSAVCPGTDMFSPEVKEAIHVEKVPSSNIHIVDTIRDLETLRVRLIAGIGTMLYEGVREDEIVDALQQEQDPIIVAKQLNALAEQRKSSAADHGRPPLAKAIPSLIKRFQKNEGTLVSSNCQHIQEGDLHYYGIHKGYQMQHGDSHTDSTQATRELYQRLKISVLQIMGLPADTCVVQVVGDSAPYSQRGTELAKDFLRKNIPDGGAVLYGYTGHKEDDGTRCVNAALSDVLAERGMEGRAIANLVGFHTPLALQEWGCTGPDTIKHFFLVYGDDESCRERGTVFGDDVTTSDFVADRLFLLDGGAQSFQQVCNALLLNQDITVLYGLRPPEKAYATEGSLRTPYFDAAQFLIDVKNFVEQKEGVPTEPDLQAWYAHYFGSGRCYVVDPKKPDADTKQKLMDQAWALFLQKKLYLQLSRCALEKIE